MRIRNPVFYHFSSHRMWYQFYTDACHYELINYKDTKTKCRLYWCLIEFMDWRYSQSSQACWYFQPSFMNYCTSNLLSGSSPSFPPFPKTIFCRSLTLCFWPDSEPTKSRRGGGPQTDIHLPQSPFTGHFSISLIFARLSCLFFYSEKQHSFLPSKTLSILYGGSFAFPGLHCFTTEFPYLESED